MGQNHIWIHVAVLPVMESMPFKPAQVLTVILEVAHGRSDQQMNPTLGVQLGMEKKYSSSTSMEQNPTWIHVAIHPVAVSILFKLAQVLIVLPEVVHGRSNLQLEPKLGNQLLTETKYILSTNMGQNHIWIHVGVLPVMESMPFKPAQVLTVILEVVLGKLYWKRKVNE